MPLPISWADLICNMVILGAFVNMSNLGSLQSMIDGLAVALKGIQKLIKSNKEPSTPANNRV
jgi:Pyruvate/2-oxoacid:ferredoxin oxidoreductase gamma subunit